MIKYSPERGIEMESVRTIRRMNNAENVLPIKKKKRIFSASAFHRVVYVSTSMFSNAARIAAVFVDVCVLGQEVGVQILTLDGGCFAGDPGAASRR